jgi:4-amino-4-deoxy-L-arabinose transferase-like glycosyltransferase
MNRTSTVVTPGVLMAAALLLYVSFIVRSPVFLNNDEAVFAVQAHAIASTLHDNNGRLLPLYFQIHSTVWYQPAIVYLMAAFFTVLPVAEWSVRLPTVLVAMIDIALIATLARRLLGSGRAALLAGALLTLTPSHFIHGRLACDYLYPAPFVLAAFWCLLRFLERPQRRLLVAAGLILGLGFYSYIASVVMMPVYALLMCAVLIATQPNPAKPCLWLSAGFAAALVPLALWLPSHLAAFYGAVSRYNLARQMELGFAANLWNHLTVFARFFDPAYLFARDRGAVTSSTGRAGVFALSMAALVPLGIYQIVVRRRTPAMLFVLAGFFAAPIAATFVNEPYTTDRALMLVPFGVLIGAFGLEHLLTSRERATRLAATALLALIPAQFAYFYYDYMNHYRLRSAFWFNSNNRGALEEIIAEDPPASARPVYLADNIPFIPFYWKLYLIKHHREDLLDHTVYFNLDNLDDASMPANSLILTNDDSVEKAMIDSGRFRRLRRIYNPDDTEPFSRLEKHPRD